MTPDNEVHDDLVEKAAIAVALFNKIYAGILITLPDRPEEAAAVATELTRELLIVMTC